MSDEQKQRDPRDRVVLEVGTCDDKAANRKIAVRLVCYDNGPLRVQVAHEGRGRLGRIDPLVCGQLGRLLVDAMVAAAEETEKTEKASGKYDDSLNTKETLR